MQPPPAMKPEPSAGRTHTEAKVGGKTNAAEPGAAKSSSATRACPPATPVYLAALTALASAEASPQEVGAIVAQDPVLAARLLQAVNSAHYGLARRIREPADAITLLGFDRVWSLLAGLAQADDDAMLAVVGAAHAGLLSPQPAASLPVQQSL